MQRAVIFPSPRWRARMPRRCTQRLQEAKHACLKGCDQRCNDHKDAGPNLRAVGALETLQPKRLQSNLRNTATTAMSEQHILLPDGCASHSSEAVSSTTHQSAVDLFVRLHLSLRLDLRGRLRLRSCITILLGILPRLRLLVPA